MRFQQQKENMEKQRLTGLFDDLMLNSIIEELMIPCTNQSDNSISETQAILSQRKTIAYNVNRLKNASRQKVPHRWQRPETYVNNLKAMNDGRQMIRLSSERNE